MVDSKKKKKKKTLWNLVVNNCKRVLLSLSLRIKCCKPVKKYYKAEEPSEAEETLQHREGMLSVHDVQHILNYGLCKSRSFFFLEIDVYGWLP